MKAGDLNDSQQIELLDQLLGDADEVVVIEEVGEYVWVNEQRRLDRLDRR